MKSPTLFIAGVLFAAAVLGAEPETRTGEAIQTSVRTLSGADNGELILAVRNAGVALKAQNLPEAQRLYEKAVAALDIEREPTSWLSTQLSLCYSLSLQGLRAEAISLAREVAKTCEMRMGPSDPVTIEALGSLALLLRQNDRVYEAESIYRRRLALVEKKYGRENFPVAQAATQLGAILTLLGKDQEAEELHRRALAICESSAVQDMPETCLIMTNLADCLLTAGKPGEAIEIMDKAYEISSAKDEGALSSPGLILRTQADFYRKLKQFDRAEELGRRAVVRLAARSDIDRAKFYYYDRVTDVYRAILRDRGMDETAIEEQMKRIESGEFR